jgi:hypothetical protein
VVIGFNCISNAKPITISALNLKFFCFCFKVYDGKNDHEYVPFVVYTSWFFPHPWLVTGFVTRLTQWVSLVEQELITVRCTWVQPQCFCGIRVTRSLVFCVVLRRSLLAPLSFFFWPLCCRSFDLWILITLRKKETEYACTYLFAISILPLFKRLWYRTVQTKLYFWLTFYRKIESTKWNH